MTINPLWRWTLGQWKKQLALWSRWRDTPVWRLSDIFFDFRPVCGAPAMAADLHRHLTALAQGNPAFLRQIYEYDVDHRVALGFFGCFITETDDEDRQGKINLKHTGTLPLVEAAHLLAPRQGIEDVSTTGRRSGSETRGFGCPTMRLAASTHWW
jgi:CBS domain-containing protein